jgi:hypothetical protein
MNKVVSGAIGGGVTECSPDDVEWKGIEAIQDIVSTGIVRIESGDESCIATALKEVSNVCCQR